mgnify:CR=1 FL=1
MHAFSGFGGWRFYFCFIGRPKFRTGIDGSPKGKGGGEGMTKLLFPFVDEFVRVFVFNES